MQFNINVKQHKPDTTNKQQCELNKSTQQTKQQTTHKTTTNNIKQHKTTKQHNCFVSLTSLPISELKLNFGAVGLATNWTRPVQSIPAKPTGK